LPEQGIDCDIVGRQRGGVRACCTSSRSSSATFHRDNWFAPTDAASDARETPWVAEGLQVEEDDAGLVVFLPILQQVVARDVGLIPDADKGREP
jgi:hypothetical protein